jgi:hypothetical protein
MLNVSPSVVSTRTGLLEDLAEMRETTETFKPDFWIALP